jgi:DNA-3-methyladenine glycosylase
VEDGLYFVSSLPILDSLSIGITCLQRPFYERDTSVVARDLLGKKLVRLLAGNSRDQERLVGIITETEAYGGEDDPASHAFHGSTPRNSIMFERGGLSYVYFIYGMYHCMNVSARSKTKKAGAVLIRSILPIEGINKMVVHRNSKNIGDLANGPGKLTRALLIDRSHNGLDLTDSACSLHIENGKTPRRILAAPRIGISVATEMNWRFKLP